MRRLLGIVVVGALLVAGTTACKRNDRSRTTVLDALQRTQQLSGRYVYDDNASGTDTVVHGIVADDYRYKSDVSVNGSTKVDEVVLDDALADLFVDSLSLPLLARRSPDGTLLLPPPDVVAMTKSGISVLDALESHRWVVDATGAPQVTGTTAKHPIGQDPIFDARSVFTYAQLAARQAITVTKYDAESTTPTFKPQDDPFPKPKHGARLTRYDLGPPPVPRKDSTNGLNGGNQQVPDVTHFRRMVIYVENGLVVRIMEVVDLQWKLNDVRRNYSLSLAGSPAQQAATALAGINTVRVGQGNEPIRARSMDFQFLEPGQSQDVALPTQAVYGPLDVLVNRGRTTTR
ncbi:MAG: hypothetical protein ACYDH6_23780 [Acidimicrobiales bacterium]